MENGRLVIMGEIDTVEHVNDEPRRHPMALLIEFDSVESIRQAIADGECKFSFGEPNAKAAE